MAGGLALAFFSFNSSESSPQIAAVPREIIYVPPPNSQAPESDSRFGTADARALLQSGSHVTANSFADSEGPEAPEHPFRAETFELAQTERALNKFNSSPVAWFAEQNPADLGLFAAKAAASSEAAFSGVAAPVPEPSTWAMLVSGAGVVVAALRRRTRRQSAPARR